MDFAFLQNVKADVEALLNALIVDTQGRVIGEIRHAQGNTIYQIEASSGAGSSIKGEWDPAASYDAGDIVFFTPDGEAASTFYALLAVSGTSPDTGAPNWAEFPQAPAGIWA